MKRDLQKGGTNADGSKNPDYCSYCYKEGGFVQPDFTAAQMQTFCIEKMKETGMPGFVGWLLTRNIPKLERWKNS